MVLGHRMELHDPAVDRHLSGHLASGAAYEPFETQLVLRSVREGDCVLDARQSLPDRNARSSSWTAHS